MQALQAASQRILSPTLIAMKNGIYSSRIIPQQLHKVAQTRLMTTTATATATPTAAAISSRNGSRVFLLAPFVSFIVFETVFLVASQDSDVTSTWRRRHHHHHRYQIMLNKKSWQNNNNNKNNKHFTV